jgi:hypothetical protein
MTLSQKTKRHWDVSAATKPEALLKRYHSTILQLSHPYLNHLYVVHQLITIMIACMCRERETPIQRRHPIVTRLFGRGQLAEVL